MPGSPDHTTKHYICPPYIYRKDLEANDTDVPADYLHLEANQHAVDNYLFIILEDLAETPTPGATVTLTIYAKFDGSVKVPVIQGSPITGVTAGQLITVPGVPAYPIAIKVTGMTSGKWTIHAGHTAPNTLYKR